jgi:excisionase family DNA binding protein
MGEADMPRNRYRPGDFQFNYFEVVVQPKDGCNDPPQTFVSRLPKGLNPSPDLLLAEANLIDLVPLTPTELAYYLGVELKQIEDWIEAGEVKTIKSNGATRIPFSEYERRVKGAQGLQKLKEDRRMRVSITGLIHEGCVVENGYRDGYPVFATPEQVARKG